jgi:lysophospholipase L1-like esterase
MKKKIIIVTLITITVLIVAVEIYLRSYWGFCDTVLTQESNKYEYIAQPNQNRFRFRKHIMYNESSMRSRIVDNQIIVRGGGKITLLGFGDSVINGGVQTEQDSLATSVIEHTLSQESSKNVRCLNISYGSWGPDNCYAYLEEKGDFDADLIFLVVSSHDAHDNMDFQKVIDVHPSYPSKQYKSAVYELFDRYIIPRIARKKETEDHIVKGNIFNPGFLSFYNYTQEKQIPFFIYLHPDRQEVREEKYDEQGEKIIEFCIENNISLLQGIEYENDSLFRDGIHLNEHGQRILANTLLTEIKRLLNLQ